MSPLVPPWENWQGFLHRERKFGKLKVDWGRSAEEIYQAAGVVSLKVSSEINALKKTPLWTMKRQLRSTPCQFAEVDLNENWMYNQPLISKVFLCGFSNLIPVKPNDCHIDANTRQYLENLGKVFCQGREEPNPSLLTCIPIGIRNAEERGKAYWSVDHSNKNHTVLVFFWVF